MRTGLATPTTGAEVDELFSSAIPSHTDANGVAPRDGLRCLEDDPGGSIGALFLVQREGSADRLERIERMLEELTKSKKTD